MNAEQIIDETIDRVCRGVASTQEGQALRAYIAALREREPVIGPATVVRAFRKGDVVFIEPEHEMPQESIERAVKFFEHISVVTGVNIGLLPHGMHVAATKATAIMLDHDNSAFRWICNKCETVNGHEAASCVACRTPRYPFTAAQAYAARTNLMAAVAGSPTFTGTPTIAGTPAVEKLTEWLVRAVVTLAKASLADANADSERGNGVWPADQEWYELNGTSQSIFMHRARNVAGIDHDQYLGYIRESTFDLDTLWDSLSTDPAAAAEVLPPVAWMAGDGRLMSHGLKMSQTHAATQAFVIPLWPHPTEPATTCTHKIVDGIALTACGKELESLCSDWDFCPYCGDPVELVE